jgi:type IV secretion system protein VirD4
LSDATSARANLRPILFTTTGLIGGAAALSAAATQFVAYRVGYHPAIGAPLFEHVYAPWQWFEWQQSAWAGNAKRTFQIVDASLFGVSTVALFGGLAYAASVRRRPKKHEGVHGTAHFQTEADIRKSGLLPAKTGGQYAGVYVGGWTDRKGQTHYLRHDGPEHLIVIAPTRSGKGVGNVNTTLLSWPASCAVYDEKGELWELTAGWRARHANSTAIRLEFGAVDGSAGFNFLEEVRIGTPHEVADAQNIAQMLCDPHGKGLEDHWQKTSFALLAGLVLHVLYTHRARNQIASLADVAYALSDPARPADELWQEMVDNQHLGTGPQTVVAAAGRDMVDREARERGSVLSSAKTYLTLFQDPLIAQNTRRSDFRIMDLMNHERPVSLYIVTRGSDKERLRPLVRLLFTMMTRTLMGVPLKFQNGQPIMLHKHRLLMMLDEFPSLGRMSIIEDALPKCAGYGIKCFLAAQDREQMFAAYGQHQTITGNCHIRIIYAPNERETARWVSDMIGTTTIVKEDVTESGHRMGALSQISRSYHEVSRPLMTPDEISTLKKPQKLRGADGKEFITEAGEMVVFVAGENPIKGTQVLYFLDPLFRQRAAIPPPSTGSTIARQGSRFHARQAVPAGAAG